MPLLPQPIDFDAVRLALVASVSKATGLPPSQVIMLEPEAMGAPRPPVPYVGILVTTPSIKRGQDWSVPVDDLPSTPTGLFTYAGDRTMAVGFDFFGATHEQAYGLAACYQAAMDQPPTLATLELGGLAVRNIGDVADISSLLNTQFEGRAHLDCSFGLVSAVTVDVGRMDSFTIAGGTFAGEIHNTTTITVTRGD